MFQCRHLVAGLAAGLILGLAAAPAGAQAPAPAAGQPAPAGPVRTETTPFDNWVLTCQETTPAGAKTPAKTCWATMRVTDKERNQVLLVWILGKDAKGVPTLSLQTPTGLLLKDGLAITLGGKTRRAPYVACDARSCEASMPYDAAFATELAASKEAAVTFTTRDGRDVTVKLPLSGTDKVLAALKK